ncbi:hypothetical protein CRM71_12520 [Prevotella jejuni]|nr:hypothetical protein CRM71_12520 [Prevotella jejuni]
MLVKKGCNHPLATAYKSFVFKKLHDCKGEGPPQGSRTCPSRGKKGVFYEQEGRLLHACKASSKIKRENIFTKEGVSVGKTNASRNLHPSISTIVQHRQHATNKRLIERLY